MDGEEELAGPSRLPPLTRWLVAGAALAAVAIVALQLSGGAGFGALSAPSPAPSAAAPRIPQWPRAAGACGSGLLPIVSSAPITPKATGLSVLLGGDQLRHVDLDTGATTIVPGADPQAGQSVTQLRGASPTYAVLSGCDPLHDVGLIRISAGAPTRPVSTTGSLRNVLSADGQAWAVIGGLSSTKPGLLRSLDGRGSVPTPRGFTPLGVIGSRYVGEQLQPGPLFGEDPPTIQARELRAGDDALTRLGRGQVIAVTPTGVLWLPPCLGGAGNACTLVYQSLAPAGPPRSFRLPLGRVPTARGVVSPDGERVAFTLQRNAPDARYPSDAAPTDVAVFTPSSGALAIVPGVELPTAPVPGLAFSGTGWLILAVNNGPTTRLLAWRPGLARPLETPAVPAVANGRPPLVVLPITR